MANMFSRVQAGFSRVWFRGAVLTLALALLAPLPSALAVVPTVVNNTPVNGAANVPVNAVVTVTFSTAMIEATVNTGTFYLDNGVTGTVVYDAPSLTATLTPDDDLAPGTVYTATVTTGVADAAAADPLAADHVFSFTTGSTTDNTPPAVSGNSPADGASAVPLNAVVTATFSEPMNAATLNTSTFTMDNGVSGTVAYDAATWTATFTPDADLGDQTTYTATVTTGALDASGNALAAAHSWNFETGSVTDLTPPEVETVTPAAGASGVPVNAIIRVTFSEAMSSSTINTSTFYMGQGVTGAVTYDAASRTATLTPSADLTEGWTYAVTISRLVRDLAGNSLAADIVWTFTVSGQAAAAEGDGGGGGCFLSSF